MVIGPRRKVTLGTLLSMGWRSFFLQSCWNFQRMQNVGFAFAMIPLIKKLRRTREQRVRMLKRHLEYFNTHPYCASLIFGVVARFEEEAKFSQPNADNQAMRLKAGMMGPLAALGDTVFWASLKPALALIAVGFVLLSPRNQVWPALLGPLLFLLLFSVFHLWVRLGGLYWGYERGLEIVKDLRNFNPQFIARQLQIFIAMVLGGMLGLYSVLNAGTFFPAFPKGLAILLGLLVAGFAALRLKISASGIFYLLIGLGLLAGYLHWI